MASTFACPRCKAACEQCGELDDRGQSCRVYQCETCTVDFEMEGESFPAAYTFVVGADGVARDPAEPFDPFASPN